VSDEPRLPWSLRWYTQWFRSTKPQAWGCADCRVVAVGDPYYEPYRTPKGTWKRRVVRVQRHETLRHRTAPAPETPTENAIYHASGCRWLPKWLAWAKENGVTQPAVPSLADVPVKQQTGRVDRRTVRDDSEPYRNNDTKENDDDK
jgi:hypothetical protein